MACRLAPGIGPGHFLMVAVDDFEGDSVSMKERLFSFDVPVVSTITRGSGPTSGMCAAGCWCSVLHCVSLLQWCLQARVYKHAWVGPDLGYVYCRGCYSVLQCVALLQWCLQARVGRVRARVTVL
jgi:hypothetical protein